VSEHALGEGHAVGRQRHGDLARRGLPPSGLRPVGDFPVPRGSAAASCIGDGRRLVSASKAVNSPIRRVMIDTPLRPTPSLGDATRPAPVWDIPERTHRGYDCAGKMYEVRISNTARYMTDHDATAPLTADRHTIALYRFDEGSGDVLNDSSGNRHHGKIVGAKWVKTEGSRSSRPPAAQTRLPSNAAPSAAARKSGLSRHTGATTRPREIPGGVCRAGTCNTLRLWLGSSCRS
jgi:hypothetical protein